MSETQDSYVFWKPEVNQRGTFNIIVTCFTTLGICLWSALHLSIPQKKRSWTQNLGVKLLWMTIGLFLPELLIITAIDQRRRAAKLRDKVNAHFRLLDTQRQWYQRWFRWTVATAEAKDEEEGLVKMTSNSPSIHSGTSAHQVLADPSEKQEVAPVLTLHNKRSKPGRHRWTLVHGFFAEMGGYAIYDNDNQLCILNSKFIEHLLKHSPDLVPDLSEDTILDKSKADGLAKALLFTQAGWFCISCLNRLVQDFPLTLLEISALAHALCSMVVYILWWHKPLNIQEPVIISNIASLETQKWPVRTGNWFDIEHTDGENERIFDVVVIIISLAYGAPHLLAWSSPFATYVERLLWRVASCVVTGSGVYLVALWLISTSFLSGRVSDDMQVVLFLIVVPLSSLVYFSASLYLLAESLRQLFHLPPTAFQTPVWSSYFPHFS